MCLVHKHEFVCRRIKFLQAPFGRDALDAGNGDVCSSRGVNGAHLNLDPLVRIGQLAMSCGLLNQLTAMGQNKSPFSSIWARVDLINELCENDLNSHT